jgi:O-antigen ligase
MQTTHVSPAAPVLPDTAPLQDRLRALLLSDGGVLAGMFVATAIYYLLPGLPAAVVGAALFLALAIWRPHLTPAPIIAAAALFLRPRAIGHYNFALAESLIAFSVAAWIIRDGLALLNLTPRFLIAANPDTTQTSERNLVRILKIAVRRPFAWAAVAFLIAGALSLVLPHPAQMGPALREFRWTIIEPALFFALMARYVVTQRDVFRVLNTVLVSCALNAQVGVDQALFGDTWSMEGVGRAIGLFNSATAFGIYVGRGLAMALVLAMFLPGATDTLRRWRWAYAILAIPLALGTVASFTRGAWLGVGVAVVVTALLARSRRLLASIFVLGALGAVYALLSDVERLNSIFSLTGGTNVSRLTIWQSALRVIKAHPLTGIGLDQFLYQEGYGIPQNRFQTVSHPHNWILDTWLRLGIWGLALMALTFAVYFWLAGRAYWPQRGTVRGALLLALIAGMTDHVIHGLVDMAYFTQDLALVFWMMLGLLGAVLLLPKEAVPGSELSGAIAPSYPTPNHEQAVDHAPAT